MAPTGLVATAGDARVDLAWNVVLGASKYEVKRGTSPSSLTSIAVVTDTAIFTDYGLTDGQTYYYAVSAVNGQSGVESSNSSVVSAMPFVPAPANLQAYVGNAYVWLTWNDVPGAAFYLVVRDGSTIFPVTSVTNYLDSSVVNGNTYSYVVYTFTSHGHSASSNPVNAVPVGPPPPPGLTSAAASGSMVSIVWAPSPGATSYNLLRSTSPGTGYSPAATIDSPASTYHDTIEPGVPYYYVVQAVNAWGTSSVSNELTVVTLIPPILFASANSISSIQLDWTQVPGATTYAVARAVMRAQPTPIADAITALSLLDTLLAPATPYVYQIRAVSGANSSDWSPPIIAMTLRGTISLFSANFVSGVTAQAACSDFEYFRSTLDASAGYSQVILSGTGNSAGLTCSDPAIATALAAHLRDGTVYTSPPCNGQVWHVGLCGAGPEITAAPGNTCACDAGNAVRPCIGDSNWGGIQGATCAAASQTMTVAFVPAAQLQPPASFVRTFSDGSLATSQCTDFKAFLSGLVPGNYQNVTLLGTNDSWGRSCTDPIIVNILATNLRNGTSYTSPPCGGHVWSVGNCEGQPEISAGAQVCACSAVGYSFRPCIGNSNWGGVNTPTCGGPNQTMGLAFE